MEKNSSNEKTAFQGYFDGVDGLTAVGWAWNPDKPEERLEVVILADDVPVAEGVADQFRDDVLQAGIGDGRYGFKIKLPERLADDKDHEIKAEIKNTERILGKTKLILNKIKAYKGNFDGIKGLYVIGWAYNEINPQERVEVVILTDDVPVAEGVADQFREDLLQAGIGDGKHGFCVKLPDFILDNTEHEISVVYKKNKGVLPSSPKEYIALKVRDFSETTHPKDYLTEFYSILSSLKPGVELFHIILPENSDYEKIKSLSLITNKSRIDTGQFYTIKNKMIIPIPDVLWTELSESENNILKIQVLTEEVCFDIKISQIVEWFKRIFIWDFGDISYQHPIKQFFSLHALACFFYSSQIRNMLITQKELHNKILEFLHSSNLHSSFEAIDVEEQLINLQVKNEIDFGAKIFNEYFIEISKHLLMRQSKTNVTELVLSNFLIIKREDILFSLIPIACVEGKVDLLRGQLDVNLIKKLDIPNKYHLCLYLIFTEDPNVAQNIIHKLSDKNVPGWLATQCIYYFINNKILNNLDYSDWELTDKLIYALIHFFDSFNDEERWFSRVYDKYLVLTAISLLSVVPYLPPWTQIDLINCCIRNYGLNYDFWEFMDNNILDREPILQKAKSYWENLKNLFESSNLREIALIEVLTAIRFFIFHNNKDAVFMLRELGYSLMCKGDEKNAKLIFEELSRLDKEEILRYYAHPFLSSSCNKYESKYIASLIREHIQEVPKNLSWYIENELGKALIDMNESKIREILPYILKNSEKHAFIGYPFAINFSDNVSKLYRMRVITTLLDKLEIIEKEKILPPSIETALFNVGRYEKEVENLIKLKELKWLQNPPEVYLNDDKFHPFFNDTLFIIYSCQKNLDTRINQIRETYIKDLNRLRIPYLIVVGGSNKNYVAEDVLYLNVSDDYESLPKKTIALLEWVYYNTPFYYVFKIDDDSYIDVEKFLANLEYRKHHYYGRSMKKGLDVDRTWHKNKVKNQVYKFFLDKSFYHNITYADGGSGYCLTRFSIYKILQTVKDPKWQFILNLYLYEDVLVGILLSLNEIVPNSSEYFVSKQYRVNSSSHPVHMWNNYFYPSRSNPISYVHLDTDNNFKLAHEIKNSNRLYPPKVWSSASKVILNRNSNQLELLNESSKLKEIILRDPIAIIPIRNERSILPHFLSYYRKIGIESFIFIDNISDDGTREYLLEQSDVVVFSVDTEYKASHYGVVWQHAILSNFCFGKWVLLIDADEFLIYPDSENVNLKEYIKTVENKGYNAIRADLLDIYPKRLSDLDFSMVNPFDIELFFDRYPFIINFLARGKYSNCEKTSSSNLRQRICPLVSVVDFTSVKYPILKYYPWVRLCEGIHFITPANKVIEGEAFLLHLKYHKEFKRKVITEVFRKQHFESAREYKKYYLAIKERDEGFYDPEISIRYKNSSELIRYLNKLYCHRDGD